MILFCATDAGGAREIIPVAEEARRRNLLHRILSSIVTRPLFAQRAIAAEVHPFASVAEAGSFLRETPANILCMGTAVPIKSEQYLTAAAREQGIPSLAILDEWYNYDRRFRDEEGYFGMYLPDIICVQDELSRMLAAEEGLPAARLRVTGSPSLADTAQWAKKLAASPPACPPVLQREDARPSVLFLSEPLAMAYGRNCGEGGAYGSFLGFQEDIVRNDLAEILSALGQPVLVVEKLHPSEKGKNPPGRNGIVQWRTEAGTSPLWPLLWHADIILGMRSKTLLEAALLGRQPVSYQPGSRDPQHCTAVRVDLAEVCTDKQTFAGRLGTLLREKPVHGPLPLPPFAVPDAAERVCTLLETQSASR